MIVLTVVELAAIGLLVLLIILCLAGCAFAAGRRRAAVAEQRRYANIADLKQRYSVRS